MQNCKFGVTCFKMGFRGRIAQYRFSTKDLHNSQTHRNFQLVREMNFTYKIEPQIKSRIPVDSFLMYLDVYLRPVFDFTYVLVRP